MSKRSLLILSIVTVLAIAAAVISSQSRAPQPGIRTTTLFPGLAERVNEVARVVIRSQDGAVHVNKGDSDWLVEEADNYPAQFEKVKQLVLNTADLEILNEKTSNPAFYPELGVEDPAAEDASSRLVTLMDAAGNELASLIAGNKTGSGATGGQYVRKPDSEQTLLVDGTLDTPADPGQWIVTELLNIAADRVMEVRIQHPDGAVVTLTRPEGEENFQVADVPGGRESRSQYFTNQPARFLTDLRIENAKARAGFQFPEDAVNTVIRTYDGLVASMTAAKVDSLNHVTLEFSVDESLASEAAGAGEGAEAEEIVIGEQPEKVDIGQEAAALNEKVSDWIFIIPQSKYLLLIKRPEELLKDVEEETEAAE